MASWKKVIVSGSDISQLNNDANYIVDGQDNVVLSGSFTGSFTGDGSGLTNLPPQTTPNSLTDGNGIVDFTFDGSSAATVAVEADGSTISVGASGIKVADSGIDTLQLADGGVTNIKLANDSVTIGTTEIDLGASSTTLAGLTSVTSTAFVGDLTGTADTASYVEGANVDGQVSSAVTADTASYVEGANVDGAVVLANTASYVEGANVDGAVALATTASHADAVAPNSVALGTDTTGDYVANLGTGTGVTIGSNTGEGSTPTISVDYGSTANTAVEGNTSLTIQGTANEIEVSGGSITLGAGGTATVGLPDDVTITQDLTVGRNLVVQGTASFQHTEDLAIADRFILLASGSTSAGDGGLVVQQTTQDVGEVFAFDNANVRWGVSGSFDASQNTFTPDAFMANALVGTGTDPNAVDARYDKGGNIFVGTDEEIWIYS